MVLSRFPLRILVHFYFSPSFLGNRILLSVAYFSTQSQLPSSPPVGTGATTSSSSFLSTEALAALASANGLFSSHSITNAVVTVNSGAGGIRGAGGNKYSNALVPASGSPRLYKPFYSIISANAGASGAVRVQVCKLDWLGYTQAPHLTPMFKGELSPGDGVRIGRLNALPGYHVGWVCHKPPCILTDHFRQAEKSATDLVQMMRPVLSHTTL